MSLVVYSTYGAQLCNGSSCVTFGDRAFHVVLLEKLVNNGALGGVCLEALDNESGGGIAADETVPVGTAGGYGYMLTLCTWVRNLLSSFMIVSPSDQVIGMTGSSMGPSSSGASGDMVMSG